MQFVARRRTAEVYTPWTEITVENQAVLVPEEVEFAESAEAMFHASIGVIFEARVFQVETGRLREREIVDGTSTQIR